MIGPSLSIIDDFEVNYVIVTMYKYFLQVWSFGTTLWQIFSHGAEPVINAENPSETRLSYINGHILPKPANLPVIHSRFSFKLELSHENKFFIFTFAAKV